MYGQEILDISAKRAFIISDFDGTLSPIVSEPLNAEFEVDAVATLVDLSFRFKTVAILSGRSSDFILSKAAVSSAYMDGFKDQIKIFGLYGNENLKEDLRLTEAVADIARELDSQFSNAVLVENKLISVTVHYRNNANKKRVIGESIDSVLSNYREFTVIPAKMSYEVVPKIFKKKGDVITDLLKSHDGGYYLGDDVGDLDAFKALKMQPSKATCSVAVRSTDTPQDVINAADISVGSTKEAVKFLKKLKAEFE